MNLKQYIEYILSVFPLYIVLFIFFNMRYKNYIDEIMSNDSHIEIIGVIIALYVVCIAFEVILQESGFLKKLGVKYEYN